MKNLHSKLKRSTSLDDLEALYKRPEVSIKCNKIKEENATTKPCKVMKSTFQEKNIVFQKIFKDVLKLLIHPEM